jgi:hypothetical protein
MYLPSGSEQDLVQWQAYELQSFLSCTSCPLRKRKAHVININLEMSLGFRGGSAGMWAVLPTFQKDMLRPPSTP